MQIKTIKSKEQLNSFIAAQERSSFSQSWEWGEFKKVLGNKIFRIGVVDDTGELLAAATIIKKNLPLGKSYLFCPRGPVLECRINNNKTFNTDASLFLFEEINKVAKKENAIFFRFEPDSLLADDRLPIAKTLDIEPSKTIMLDLSKSEDELIAAMHQKTRYNIRLAEKKGVAVEEAGLEKFDEFWRIMEDTGERDEFRLHGKEHYQKMIEAMGSRQAGEKSQAVVKLYLAYFENRPIASILVCFYGDTATYLHGGSSNEYRNLMAPYLLQWQAIKISKKYGYLHYDLYGIDEEKWPGVTRFKSGFGGKRIEYPGTFDLVLDKVWYLIYQASRKINRLR